MKPLVRIVLAGTFALVWWLGPSLVLGQSEPIDFQRDIRPILSNHCFACHGPDEQHREADLRLDHADSALDSVIIAGDPQASELIQRIMTDDPELIMPPPELDKPLTSDQVDVLRKWIEQGAAYDGHWAFVAPQRPTVPNVSQTNWIRNPIDAFVLDRLQSAKVDPSPEADRVTWLRRVSLDLIGLPPNDSTGRRISC